MFIAVYESNMIRLLVVNVCPLSRCLGCVKIMMGILLYIYGIWLEFGGLLVGYKLLTLCINIDIRIIKIILKNCT